MSEAGDHGERNAGMDAVTPMKRKGLDPKIQEALGRALKAYSADIISEPIPDRFTSLLAQLESKERRND